VVPLFQRQLAQGGPLTVTHPDVTRFFMTTREAVELILQAAAMPGDVVHAEGKIFVLDMGEPVRIQDLARQMIRLAGRQPDKDVKIVFTGLRPGEKLYEEVLHSAETTVPTPQDGVMLASPRIVDRAELERAIADLVGHAERRDTAAVVAGIAALVPEFQHAPNGQGNGEAEPLDRPAA
jgi:FlaA1/EpsC-like NDP-sugar epimerase